jgi:hypothetical protein
MFQAVASIDFVGECFRHSQREVVAHFWNATFTLQPGTC